MNRETASRLQSAEADVVWARVDDGFYVASLPGRFVGCIDKRGDAEFLALDVHSRPIGTYPQLAEAMTAVWNATAARSDA